MIIQICQRCDHAWYQRKDEYPKVCPKCKSAYWDTPRPGKNRKEKPTRLIK